MSRISIDIDVAHRRRWPGRPMSLASCSWLLASSPGLRLMLTHRLDHWLFLKRTNNNACKRLWRAMMIPVGLLNVANHINTKSAIYNQCEIEGSVTFSDQGYIIFGATKVGSGTVIGTRVTFGMSHVDLGRPEIGRNVWVGSDCLVYGAISIGDGATLLPGTVLTKNVPAGAVMQGNPARLILRNFDNSELRECGDMDVLQYITANQGC